MNDKLKVSLFFIFSVASTTLCMDENRVQEKTNQKPKLNNPSAWKRPSTCVECLIRSCLFICCIDEKQLGVSDSIEDRDKVDKIERKNEKINFFPSALYKKSSTIHVSGVKEDIWLVEGGYERQEFFLPDGSNRTYDVKVPGREDDRYQPDYSEMDNEMEINRQIILCKYRDEIKP